MVVEPTSMATPKASSTYPGQIATMRPSRMAAVAVPPAIAAWTNGNTSVARASTTSPC